MKRIIPSMRKGYRIDIQNSSSRSAMEFFGPGPFIHSRVSFWGEYPPSSFFRAFSMELNVRFPFTNRYIIHSTFKKKTLSPTSFESAELTEIINICVLCELCERLEEN